MFPLQIVYPAHAFVPPRPGNVLVNDCQTIGAKHAPHFIQHCMNVLRMMKHITEQDGIEGTISHRKLPTVVRPIMNRSFRSFHHIDTDNFFRQQGTKMMGDKPIAASDIEDL